MRCRVSTEDDTCENDTRRSRRKQPRRASEHRFPFSFPLHWSAAKARWRSSSHRKTPAATNGQSRSAGRVQRICPVALATKTLSARFHVAASSSKGAVAQLGERCVRNAEVGGSTPLRSTLSQDDRRVCDGEKLDDVFGRFAGRIGVPNGPATDAVTKPRTSGAFLFSGRNSGWLPQ